MMEPSDPYKKSIQCGMMLCNHEKKYNSRKGLIYIKPLQGNLSLNVATDEEVTVILQTYTWNTQCISYTALGIQTVHISLN